MIKKFSPIQEQDRKLDILDHVNQDHTKELRMIAQSYGKNMDIDDAHLIDIFEEGILLKIHDGKSLNFSELFVAFELNGDFEEQILYLAYNSFVKERIDFNHNTKQYFEVLHKSNISKNIIRLTIKSQLPLPQYYAGYAYGLVLKVLEKSQPIKVRSSNKSGVLKNTFDRVFLWFMKRLSNQKRQKLWGTINKDIRLYTLRQAFSQNQATTLHYGYFDIFTHGMSAGSEWVDQIGPGAIISSRTETDDKHAHIHSGQTVFIADETAYPALAGILEFLKNPCPPIVILLCTDQADFEYFNHYTFPPETILKKIHGDVLHQAQHVIEVLQQIEHIDNAWGALESDAAKKIRHFLRNEKHLLGKNNHIKGYWRLQ